MKKFFRTVLNIFLTIIFIILVIAVISTCVLTIYLVKFVDADVDSIISLAGNSGTPSRIYTVNSDGVLTEYAKGELSTGRDNDYAELSEISEYLKDAFVAIEDKRFYSHKGFDPVTTVKAATKYLFSQGSSPGGSTITQQLIKNLTGDDSISIKRKLREIMRAINLEKELSKDEILELYLNTIYLSQGTYGVKAAAKLYFNKLPSELTLIESAAIAAITQAPTKWDPIQNPENNAYRRDVIIQEMYNLGYISENEYSESYNKELVLNISYEKVSSATSSWYTDAVINEAILLISETYDISNRVATHYLYNSGFSIITSIDTDIQNIIEKYYQDKNLFGNYDVQSSFIIIDPETGYVLGLVGGLGEKSASRVLNRATQSLRSPGSSIKPLSVFAPALEKGIINYSSTFDDVPLKFVGSSGAPWPKNASGIYSGLVSLEYAVAHSLNTVSVKILEELGLQESFDFLTEELCFSSLVKDSDINDMTLSSLALGGMANGVTLKEITTAYSIFANNGIYTSSHCVLEIRDKSGKVIVDNTPTKKVIISESTSQTMTKLLEKVITESGGTAYGAIKKTSSLCSVAGKTGTTNENKDRWFIGYTPYCIGGIWLGYDTPESLSQIGTKEHIKVWDSVMSEVTKILETREGEKSFDYSLLIEATYCTASGKTPTRACISDARGNKTAIGYFTKETVPNQPCDCHILVGYCTEGKGIAGDECPHDTVMQVGLIVVSRSFSKNIFITDSEYTAMKLPTNYTPFISLSEPYFKNYIPKGTNVGSSNKDTVFNRYCSYHITKYNA